MRRVQDFAVPVETIRVAHPDDRLADIAVRPGRGRVGHMLVFDGDQLVGLVTPEAVASGQAGQAVSPVSP
jgi:hypothetical protein